MDPLTIVSRLGSENPPTDAELTAAVTDLREALDAATSADEPDLAMAKDIREALDSVVTEQANRETARETARAEARKLREGVLDDEPATDETEAEQATEQETEVKVLEPVAASGTADVIKRLRAYAEKVAPAAEVKPSLPGAIVKAIGPASGFDLNPDAGFGQVGQMFATHAKSAMTNGNVPLLRLQKHFDETRTLGSNVEQNNRRIADVLGPDARPLAAAGGLCGPGDVDHSHPICSDRGRPVRDSLIQFNASRGQVTYAPAASLGLLDGNVSIWTAATDANPGATTKPCPPVTCPEELVATVDAVVRCITIGNFQAKFSPEFWASRLELLLAQFDREAEQKALQEIHADSTVLTAVSAGNTLASFLTAINRVIATDRANHRNLNGRYRVIADAWVRDAIRNQVITNLGVANNVDALQIADAQINGWLADVNADVTWTYDGTVNPVGGTHNIQTDPNAFLAQSTVYVFPQDAFMFLDGGTLDLGTSITDSTLNATNDRQAFAESFEKVAFRGCSSYAVPITVEDLCGCPVVTP